MMCHCWSPARRQFGEISLVPTPQCHTSLSQSQTNNAVEVQEIWLSMKEHQYHHFLVHEKSPKMSWVIFLLKDCGKKDPLLSGTNHIFPHKKLPVMGASEQSIV